MPKWTDDEHLVFDLMFALSKIRLKPRGPEHDETYRRMVAERIVAHLKLANWRFEKGPPSQPHG